MTNWKTGGLLALLAIGVLTACGSSPPVQYYALEPQALSYEPDTDDAIVLGLGPLRTADYLKRSQMVTRGSNNEILVDSMNRWAEPLDGAIQHILATNVDRQLTSVVAVSFPDTDTAEIDYRLVGRVHRFDVDQNGLAVLESQWRIETGDGEPMIAQRRDRFTANSTRSNDPGANAAALTDVLGQFSRAIAETAQALPKP